MVPWDEWKCIRQLKGLIAREEDRRDGKEKASENTRTGRSKPQNKQKKKTHDPNEKKVEEVANHIFPHRTPPRAC